MDRVYKRQLCRLCVAACSLMLAAGGIVGCGGDPAAAPQLDIELYGWAPGPNGGDYYAELESYPGAHVVDVKLTQPRQRKIVDKSLGNDIQSGKVELPNLSFGDNLRLDFDLIDTTGVRIATGASPLLNVKPDSGDSKMRVMVSPSEEFAPVGGRYRNGNGGIEYQPTKFDGRANGSQYMGRVGAVAVRSSRGNAIIVGGGQVSAGLSPDATPNLQRALGDIQLFEPAPDPAAPMRWSSPAPITRSRRSVTTGSSSSADSPNRDRTRR